MKKRTMASHKITSKRQMFLNCLNFATFNHILLLNNDYTKLRYFFVNRVVGRRSLRVSGNLRLAVVAAL